MTPLPATEITHAITQVDRTLADRWLKECNSHNREISFHRWRGYAADMMDGRWKFNGETIQFDRNDVLMNGQHRLMAVRATGRTQTFLIVRGLDPDTQATMDQGTRRTPADQLKVADIDADNTIAAAARVYLQWTTDRLFGDVVANKISTTEVVEWARHNPEAMTALHDLSTPGLRRVFLMPSITLAVALRLHLLDDIAAKEFLDALVTGADLPANSPILVLRERLRWIKETGMKFNAREIIGYYTVAWNKWRTGKVTTKIQRPRGGTWTAANFPQPQ